MYDIECSKKNWPILFEIIGFDAWAVNGEGLLIHLQYVFVGSNPTQLNNLLIQHEML